MAVCYIMGLTQVLFSEGQRSVIMWEMSGYIILDFVSKIDAGPSNANS